MAHRRTHAGFARSSIDRRRFMQIGGLGGFGLTLSRLFEARSARAAERPSPAIDACILIFFYGGPSHLDTWDLKPAAPAEIRGEFRPIATRVPGLQVGEHLPLCAGVMDRVAVV